MNNLLDRFVTPALQRCGVQAWQTVEENTLIVLLDALTADTPPLLISVQVDAELQSVILQAQLYAVAVPHRGAVALLLADVNTHSPFVVFSMTTDGIVVTDITVELADSREPELRICQAFGRLLIWIRDSFDQIVHVAQHGQPRPPTRLAGEIESILATTEGGV